MPGASTCVSVCQRGTTQLDRHGVAHTSKTCITSWPWSLMTLTPILPVSGFGKGGSWWSRWWHRRLRRCRPSAPASVGRRGRRCRSCSSGARRTAPRRWCRALTALCGRRRRCGPRRSTGGTRRRCGSRPAQARPRACPRRRADLDGSLAVHGEQGAAAGLFQLIVLTRSLLIRTSGAAAAQSCAWLLIRRTIIWWQHGGTTGRDYLARRVSAPSASVIRIH